MKTTHTPGPWIIGEREQFIDRFPRILSNNGKNGIATMMLWGSDVTDANARLIAAAPDLLTTLQDLVAYCETVGMADAFNRLPAARAAITKATGE